jgi:hypothetical protein
MEPVSFAKAAEIVGSSPSQPDNPTLRHVPRIVVFQMDQFIIQNIDDAIAGSLRHPPKIGKRVLVCNEAGTAALQVLAALSERPEIGMKVGAGIVTRGADRRWRKVSSQEIVNIVKEEFVVTRLETAADGVKRLRIVAELPRPFPATILQGRWLSRDVFDWFKPAE